MTFQTPYKCCLVARNSDYQITSYMKRPEEPGPRNCETAIKNLAPAHCVERTKIHKLPCMWVLLDPDAYKVSETLISGLLETGHLTWPFWKKMYCFLTCRTSVTCPKTGLTQVGIKSRHFKFFAVMATNCQFSLFSVKGDWDSWSEISQIIGAIHRVIGQRIENLPFQSSNEGSRLSKFIHDFTRVDCYKAC